MIGECIKRKDGASDYLMMIVLQTFMNYKGIGRGLLEFLVIDSQSIYIKLFS